MRLQHLASANGIDGNAHLPQLVSVCAVAARIMAAVMTHAPEAGERQRSSGSGDAAWASHGELGGNITMHGQLLLPHNPGNAVHLAAVLKKYGSQRSVMRMDMLGKDPTRVTLESFCSGMAFALMDFR